MATKKTETEKKKTTKKSTTKKTTAKKITKKIEKPIEIVEPIVKEEVIEDEEKVLEVMNGDPTVTAPIKEATTEPVENATKLEEPKNEPKKKITRRINRAVGYFWNGQMIDF